MILFGVAVCFFAAVLSGFGAAGRSAKVNIIEDLKRRRESKQRGILETAVTSTQVGISVILVTGAILMLNVFWRLQHLNPGFDQGHVLEVDLDPGVVGYTPKREAMFLREITSKIASLPGVLSAARASRGMMREVGLKITVAPEGVLLPESISLNTTLALITPGYFRTLGIRLLSGRPLENHDQNEAPRPVVVNEAFVKLLFAGQNPLGKGIVIGTNGDKPPEMRIVGVVGTAKYRSLHEENPPILYELEDPMSPARILYIRTLGSPKLFVGEIRKLLHGHDPRVPIIATSTLEQEIESSLWRERLLALLCGFFAVVSLALSAAGIYGALAYSVSARTREIGIRIAIGAKPLDLIRAVCGRVLASAAIGAILGMAVSVLLVRTVQHFLFGIHGMNPLIFSAALGCIAVSGAVAALGPVFRAIHTDPALIMRVE